MKTHIILGITPKEFDMIMYGDFLEWAMLRSADNEKMAQKLITYKPLAKWFAMEYSKRCNEFKTAFKPYLNKNIDASTRMNFFSEMTESIFKIYPSALMNEFIKELKKEKLKV